MKVCIVLAVIVSAVAATRPQAEPRYEPYYGQQQQQQQQYEFQYQPQYQPQYQSQYQPQYQPQPPKEQLTADGYKIVPGVVDARCPRADDPIKPVHLPVRGNCAKFMKCYGGRAYEMDCPGGLEFGAQVNRCDYPALAQCSGY